MGEFLARFIGFDGRLARKPMWLGLLFLAVVAIVIQVILSPVFGFGMWGMGITPDQIGSMSMEQMSEKMIAMMPRQGWVGLVMLAILAYPMSALLIKRSHDRAKTGLLVFVYLGLSALYYVLQIAGLAFTTAEVLGVVVPVQTMTANALMLIMAVLGIYLLVTLGFLRGTEGSNIFGADPLAN